MTPSIIWLVEVQEDVNGSWILSGDMDGDMRVFRTKREALEEMRIWKNQYKQDSFRVMKYERK